MKEEKNYMELVQEIEEESLDSINKIQKICEGITGRPLRINSTKMKSARDAAIELTEAVRKFKDSNKQIPNRAKLNKARSIVEHTIRTF